MTAFRPLAGIKVFDVSHVIAGPFATLHLAMLGAEVTKIEGPHGDVMRNTAKGKAAFVALNGPKRKLRLDLADPVDRARALSMCREADVFVDNLRPSALEGLGLGFAAVHAVNKRIVYCSISGFGRDAGPRPAYDHVVQCATGMSLATGDDNGPPTKISFPLVDSATGLLAAYAILAGLRERDRTGKGMLLDVPMSGAALQLMYPATCTAMTDGIAPMRTGNKASSGSPASDVFATADGGWIATAANNPAQLARMLEVLGKADLLADAKLFEPPPLRDTGASFVRARDPTAVNAILSREIAKCNGAVLEKALLAMGVPVSRVNTLPEFVAEAERQGLIEPLPVSEDGVTVRTPGLGFRVTTANGDHHGD